MSVRKRYTRPETIESRLAVAVTKYNSANTEHILGEGADPNLRYDRSPVLFSATLPNLRALLAHGANVDIQNDLGLTLLNYHCHQHRTQGLGYDHTEYIRLLLENGADPMIPDNDGNTPLHNLCEGSIDPIIIRLLLEHGADPNHLNNEGETPLHSLSGNIFIFSRHQALPYEASIQALLAGGADPTIRDSLNHLPSQHARHTIGSYVSSQEQRMIDYLDHIERGLPPPAAGPAAAAPAAPAAAMIANVQNVFNNMPNNHLNRGNNHGNNHANHANHRNVINNRNPAIQHANILPWNTQNNGFAEANENRFGGGRRNKRKSKTVKRRKGKNKKSHRRTRHR